MKDTKGFHEPRFWHDKILPYLKATGEDRSSEWLLQAFPESDAAGFPEPSSLLSSVARMQRTQVYGLWCWGVSLPPANQ